MAEPTRLSKILGGLAQDKLQQALVDGDQRNADGWAGVTPGTGDPAAIEAVADMTGANNTGGLSTGGTGGSLRAVNEARGIS